MSAKCNGEVVWGKEKKKYIYIVIYQRRGMEAVLWWRQVKGNEIRKQDDGGLQETK